MESADTFVYFRHQLIMLVVILSNQLIYKISYPLLGLKEFPLVFDYSLIHSCLISGSWARWLLLPRQNKRNPGLLLRPRPQSTTNHATSSIKPNRFCQLNPICQHDFGSIFWQSPGGIQLFQGLVKKNISVLLFLNYFTLKAKDDFIDNMFFDIKYIKNWLKTLKTYKTL